MKHSIQIKDNSVFCDDKLVYDSRHKILASMTLDKAVVLIIDDGTNQNTISVDITGKTIWTIENREYPQSDCPANNIYMDKGKYLIYRWCGIEEEIDILTGKILSSSLIK